MSSAAVGVKLDTLFFRNSVCGDQSHALIWRVTTRLNT